MNLPNWITIGRIALVPVFVWLGYASSSDAALGAFFIFVFASLSDSLDGYLARRSGQITRLGQFLDPLADKLLVGAALVVLVDTRSFPVWAALVIAVREVAVQILRTRIVAAGGTLPASPLGKLKTVIQTVMVSWWLLPWDEHNFGHGLAIAVALIWTIASGLEYFASRRGKAIGAS